MAGKRLPRVADKMRLRRLDLGVAVLAAIYRVGFRKKRGRNEETIFSRTRGRVLMRKNRCNFFFFFFLSVPFFFFFSKSELSFLAGDVSSNLDVRDNEFFSNS